MLGKASGYDLIRLSGAEQERRGVRKRDGLQAIGFGGASSIKEHDASARCGCGGR